MLSIHASKASRGGVKPVQCSISLLPHLSIKLKENEAFCGNGIGSVIEKVSLQEKGKSQFISGNES